MQLVSRHRFVKTALDQVFTTKIISHVYNLHFHLYFSIMTNVRFMTLIIKACDAFYRISFLFDFWPVEGSKEQLENKVDFY